MEWVTSGEVVMLGMLGAFPKFKKLYDLAHVTSQIRGSCENFVADGFCVLVCGRTHVGTLRFTKDVISCGRSTGSAREDLPCPLDRSFGRNAPVAMD